MPLIPLILIVLILILLLFLIPTSLVPLRPDNAGGTERHEPQLGIPGEGQRLLSRGAMQDIHFRSGRGYVIESRPVAEIGGWKRETFKKTEEIKKPRRDLSSSAPRNAELQRQHESLSQNLDSARVFLSTADKFADSEIIQMLRKINAELQHLSTLMVERAVSVFKLDDTTRHTERKTMASGVSESVGLTLTKFLRSMAHDDPEFTLYLQIAFQAHLAHHLWWIASSWSANKVCHTFMDAIYQRLQETENQAVSGRWRSLTRTYALPTGATELDTFVTSIITGLSDILLTTNCVTSQTDIAPELSSMFEKKIRPTVLLAQHLNQMIGGVVSGDFEVFLVRNGEIFRGDLMEEDTDGSESSSRRVGAQTVLCTSELGLAKRVQLEAGGKETKTVIKAKVVLESFLDDANED